MDKNKSAWNIKDFFSKAKKSNTPLDPLLLEDLIKKKLQEKKLLTQTDNFSLLDFNISFNDKQPETKVEPEIYPPDLPFDLSSKNELNNEQFGSTLDFAKNEIPSPPFPKSNEVNLNQNPIPSLQDQIKLESIDFTQLPPKKTTQTEKKTTLIEPPCFSFPLKKTTQIEKKTTLIDPHSFSFEKSWKLLSAFSNSIFFDTTLSPDSINSSLSLLNQSKTIQILENLHYILKNIQEKRTDLSTLSVLKEENCYLKERLANHQEILTKVEESYQEKVNGLIWEKSGLENRIREISEGFEREREGLGEENGRLRREVEALREELGERRREVEGGERERMEMMKKIRMMSEEMERIRKVRKNEKLDPVASLEGLMPSKLIYEVMKFLSPKEIINLRSLNRISYHALSFDSLYYTNLLQLLRKGHKQVVATLSQELNYFHKLSSKIPEEHLKLALVKFISLKEKFGEYIPSVLGQAHKFFEIDCEIDENKENPLKKMFAKVKSISLVSSSSNLASQIQSINNTISNILPNNHFEIDWQMINYLENEKKNLVDVTLLKSDELFKKLLKKIISYCKIRDPPPSLFLSSPPPLLLSSSPLSSPPPLLPSFLTPPPLLTPKKS